MLESKDLVPRLVVGSETIDRMRREINLVVSTVLGFVYMKHESKFSNKFRIETLWSPGFAHCRWYFVENYGNPNPGKSYFEVECSLNIGFGEARFKRGYGKFDISHFHVQRVYESLPLFVDGMRKLFPFLEDYWQPLVDAADYAEKNGW